MTKRVFQAYGAKRGVKGAAMPTPRQAAVSLFGRFQNARKISVQEFDLNDDGTLTLILTDKSFKSWPDLSRAEALRLPDTESTHGTDAPTP